MQLCDCLTNEPLRYSDHSKELPTEEWECLGHPLCVEQQCKLEITVFELLMMQCTNYNEHIFIDGRYSFAVANALGIPNTLQKQLSSYKVVVTDPQQASMIMEFYNNYNQLIKCLAIYANTYGWLVYLRCKHDHKQ